MKNKTIGILLATLMITTTLPITGSVIAGDENVIHEDTSKIYTMSYDEKTYFILNDKNTNHIMRMKHLGENLCPNPSFEEGDDMLPDGWNHYTVQHSETYHWDNTQSYSGEKSIGISGISARGKYGNWYTTNLIPVDMKNKEYALSVYYIFSDLPNEGQRGGIWLELYNEHKESLRYRYGMYLEYSNHWTCDLMGTNWIREEHKNETAYVRIYLDLAGDENSKPSVEIRFDDVYFSVLENNPPLKPTIQGTIRGRTDKEYEYTLVTTDPDGDDVYYYINWGDNTSNFLGPYPSGEEISFKHNWSEKGDYTITAAARDIYFDWSNWTTLEVSMPKAHTNNHLMQLFLKISENFQISKQLIWI